MASSVDLPWDITIEILSRLPVKSLMRFTCVSISFYNLISRDPFFRKKHLHHQSSLKKVILVPHKLKTCRLEMPGFPYPILYLSPEGDVHVDLNNGLGLSHRNISFHNCRDGVFCMHKGLERPYWYINCCDGVFCMHNGLARPYRNITFHNCCDGLFCMSLPEGDAVIWNPTIRQTRRFKSCLLPNRHGLSWPIEYSLAHDSRSDVYKLLGLTIFGRNTYKLYFYSTKMGMWRYVEDSSPCDYVKFEGKPTIVNGAFHWLGSNEEHFRMPHVVVSLDISDETYGTLALPVAICDNSKFPTLCELKGKICIVSLHTEERCWDIWVMNEYGDVDSMMRMFRMPIVEVEDMLVQPYHMLEDDTLLVCQYREFYSYKDGRKLHNTIFKGHNYHVDPYVYFESLISPHTLFLHAGNAINHKIMGNGKHSSGTTHKVPEKASSSKVIANNISATTNGGKHAVAKKWWLKSYLQRLCFCKRF